MSHRHSQSTPATLDMIDADVVVVGAGLSGLACALRLHQAGCSVAVLEARDRVGGRTVNAEIGDGKVVEMGGQWVGPRHRRVTALASEVGVDTFPTHISGDHLYLRNGRVSRYRADIPRGTPFGLLDYRLAQARLERMARHVDVEHPVSDPRAARWDTLTAQSWIDRHMHTRSGRGLMQMAIEAVLAVDAAELSLLHWLFYITAGGGLDSLIRTDGGYQQDRFVGGSQEISTRVAGLLGERVHLAAPARRIEQRGSNVRVTSDALAVEADRVVIAIPPALTTAIEFDPALPGVRHQLALHMPQGAVTKCTAIYDEPFWRERGLSGHSVNPGGPIKMTFDNSPSDGKPGALLGFVVAEDSRRLSALTAADRRALILEQFAQLYGARALKPQMYLEQSWADEPWTRGCYAGYFTPGGWTSFGDALRRPVGRLHWAASETATEGHGSMDGAVSSGERAAREVLVRLGERGGVVPRTTSVEGAA